MIPLYGFLEGDTLGLLVLAHEHDTAATLARKLQDAAALRVHSLDAGAVRVWTKGGPLAPMTTVASAGLQALDRFDVREDRSEDAK
jgi:hypothetical protein